MTLQGLSKNKLVVEDVEEYHVKIAKQNITIRRKSRVFKWKMCALWNSLQVSVVQIQIRAISKNSSARPILLRATSAKHPPRSSPCAIMHSILWNSSSNKDQEQVMHHTVGITSAVHPTHRETRKLPPHFPTLPRAIFKQKFSWKSIVTVSLVQVFNAERKNLPKKPHSHPTEPARVPAAAPRKEKIARFSIILA